MKKIVIFIIALLVCCPLLGCQPGEPQASDATPTLKPTLQQTPSAEPSASPSLQPLTAIGHFDIAQTKLDEGAKQFFGNNFESMFAAMEPLAAASALYAVHCGGTYESAEESDTLWGIVCFLGLENSEQYACITETGETALTAEAVRQLMYSVTGTRYDAEPECRLEGIVRKENEKVTSAGKWACAETEDVYVLPQPDTKRYSMELTEVLNENSEIVLCTKVTDAQAYDPDTEQPCTAVIGNLRMRFKINVESRFMFTCRAVEGELYG